MSREPSSSRDVKFGDTSLIPEDQRKFLKVLNHTKSSFFLQKKFAVIG